MPPLLFLLFFLPDFALADVGVTTISPRSIVAAFGVDVAAGSGFAGYLSAMHSAGVVIVAAIAVVMIVWGAVLVFGESVWGKKSGKEKIWNAVWGLLLAAGSYVILGTVSRSLLQADFTIPAGLGANTPGVGISAREGGNINRPNRYNWSDPFEPVVGGGPQQTGDWSEINTQSELRAWQRQYMRNADYANLEASGAVRNPDGSYTLRSRVTGYWDGDPDTDAGLGAFGPLRNYSSGSIGTAAVDPSIIPYGSIITVNRGGTTQRYVAEDIGGAVVNRQASRQTAPVIDIATPSSWDGGYQSVTIQPYNGSGAYVDLSASEKDAYLRSAGGN